MSGEAGRSAQADPLGDALAHGEHRLRSSRRGAVAGRDREVVDDAERVDDLLVDATDRAQGFQRRAPYVARLELLRFRGGHAYGQQQHQVCLGERGRARGVELKAVEVAVCVQANAPRLSRDVHL